MITIGTSGTSGSSGIIGFLRCWNSNEYCPKCGSNNGDIFDYHVKCNNCDWSGKEYEFLTEEQFINNRRFKILDEILKENVYGKTYME